MTSAKRKQIISSLCDKETRDIFFEEQIDSGLPYKIRALRRARGWSQKEFAERVGMTQEGVSRLENPNYGKFTLGTLKRLASTFDVALQVRFLPYSELVDWIIELNPEDLNVPDFDHDPGLVSEKLTTMPHVSVQSQNTSDFIPTRYAHLQIVLTQRVIAVDLTVSRGPGSYESASTAKVGMA